MDTSKNLKAAWQHAPERMKKIILAELDSVLDMLGTETMFEEWIVQQNNDHLSTELAEVRIANLKKLFLAEADRLIEEVLMPIKQELKHWLYTEIDYLSHQSFNLYQTNEYQTLKTPFPMQESNEPPADNTSLTT